ncbi:MAG: 50S ribosomal protein L20 [Sedimentisphaerales bacterium]|jgi:large subunit ribosomal protein L20|nr:50S ribosomal protein L20 [Sedimentisphaerales bacterium]HML75341.1 50S ribosomal protein L20 [Anaerohalosphaeraceae bacterium]
MPRVRQGHARHQSKKRVLKAAKGFYGPRKNQIRLAKEAVVRANVYSRVGRRQKKRLFREMWIVRLNAACRERGIRYSLLINGCKKAAIELNRKMLSEIAIADPAGFDKIVEKALAAAK